MPSNELLRMGCLECNASNFAPGKARGRIVPWRVSAKVASERPTGSQISVPPDSTNLRRASISASLGVNAAVPARWAMGVKLPVADCQLPANAERSTSLTSSARDVSHWKYRANLGNACGSGFQLPLYLTRASWIVADGWDAGA